MNQLEAIKNENTNSEPPSLQASQPPSFPASWLSSLNIFYIIKPIIPRRLQIFIRQEVVCYKRSKNYHIWPIDPKSGTPPQDWKGWPNNKKFALVLSHDVDTQKGHDKCYNLMEIEESLGFRSSFNFVPERYRVSKDLRNDLVDRGFEVGVHGLKHDGKLFSNKEIFEKRAIYILISNRIDYSIR